MEKYILVYTMEGQYDEQQCIHDYIAIFPKDATDDEITFAVGKTWHELDVHSYVSAQKRVFIRAEKQ